MKTLIAALAIGFLTATGIFLEKDPLADTLTKMEFREKDDYFIKVLDGYGTIDYECKTAKYNPYVLVVKEDLEDIEFEEDSDVLAYINGDEFSWRIVLQHERKFSQSQSIIYMLGKKISKIGNKEKLISDCTIMTKEGSGSLKFDDAQLKSIAESGVEFWEDALKEADFE